MGLAGELFRTALGRTSVPFSHFGTEQIPTEQSLPIALFLTRFHIPEAFFCGINITLNVWLEIQDGSEKIIQYIKYKNYI